MKYNNELRDRVERNLRMFDYPRFDDGDIEALIGEIDRLTAELAELRIENNELAKQVMYFDIPDFSEEE